MDLEEIENEYNQELNNSNSFFLEGLKLKTDKSYLEKKYKERLNTNREKYYKRIKKFLSEHKYKKELKKNKKNVTENKKKYNYEKTYLDDLSYKFKIAKFYIKIKTRQFRDRKNIKELKFHLRKTKIKIKHNYDNFYRTFSFLWNRIEDKISKVYEKIKENSKKKYDVTKEKSILLLGKIIELLKIFNKKEKTN